MVTVALSTIADNIWQSLYDHLQVGTYAISTSNIFSAYPDSTESDVDYPIVIIHSPVVETHSAVVNRTYWESAITVDIDVYHHKAINAKQMADEIRYALINGRNALSEAGLKNMAFPEGDYDMWIEGNKKKHIATVPVTFRWVGQVS